MVQEVFNNIVKHARATHVSIDYENTGDYVYISISDNGKGFNTGELRDDSFGLKIMQERADKIGASLNVVSEPHRGTNVTIIWQPKQELIG
jgi:signal transduction histidine kinase